MLRLKEKKDISQPEAPISKEQLELEAYFRWVERGCPENDALTDWVEVEKKWMEDSEADQD